ncbi:MAG: substrate-binding domain-containing protein [Gimesia sp.]|nr:substrate-binding domain-containing protein [Gimesia sp.]
MRKYFDVLRNSILDPTEQNMSSTQAQRIALLIDTSVTFSSLVIRGVAQYAHEQPAWQILLQPRGVRDHTSVPRHWDVDGVITRVTHRTQAAALQRLGIPVINVSRSVVPNSHFPQVRIDERETATLAATHLLERGFRSLAYYSVPNQPNYEDQMGPSFEEVAVRWGGTCSNFKQWRRQKTSSNVTLAELESWLHSLPKPVGILAWDAEHGHFLCEACASAGLQIPEEVAIVCGEDDELFCKISYPPLSAVDCGPERVGYESAALLARCLAGKKVETTPLHISPVSVLSRHSTDVLAMDDRELAQALEYLRQHAYGTLQISDLLRQVPLSRRALELRFRKTLGRSPAAELRRLRVNKAKELLTNTNWAMPKIAAASGFSQTEIMNRIFRRELQQTPTQYRRATRTSKII